MKTIKLFVYALILCLSFVGVAEAKGRTGSFKSGFSSQKRAAVKPAQTNYQVPPANTQTKKTAFGSFGTANPKLDQKTASQTLPQSQMSKDLSATTAQANALKTADARTKVNEKANATNSDNGWFRSGSQDTAAPKTNTAASAGQTPQPAHYQSASQYSRGHQSSGFLPGLVGFMIGHSLAQQHTNTVYVPQNNQVVGQDANQLNNSTNADGTAIQQVQDVPVVETESFFMKLLRVVLWVAMISGIVWVVRKFMRFRNRNLQAANYSLRS
jgi:hypothetical protein